MAAGIPVVVEGAEGLYFEICANCNIREAQHFGWCDTCSLGDVREPYDDEDLEPLTDNEPPRAA